jgi:hypothetical protein
MYSVLRVPALLFGSLLIQFVSGSDNPNIVLILADDVSADMFSCYGQKGSAKTPNIDRIARRGFSLKHALPQQYAHLPVLCL